MRSVKRWTVLSAVIALSGCATTGLVSSWKAPGAEPLQLRGEKVAAVVMTSDQSIRRAGEDALARALSARGAQGIPMYTLLGDADPDEAKARAAAEQAGIVGVVVLRPVRTEKELSSTPGLGLAAPWSLQGGEIRTDTIILVETLVYSLRENKLVWGGQSKSRNPANVERLIEDTAKQVADELVRQGLMMKEPR